MANTMNAFFSSISFTEFTEIYIVGGSSAKNSEFQNILLCTLIHVVDIMHLPVKKPILLVARFQQNLLLN